MTARENPFAVHRVRRQRYRFDEADWHRLQARLAAHRHRGAIIGPHGSGKTTLLEDLGARLMAAGWNSCHIVLNRENRRLNAAQRRTLARAGTRDFVLLDGAEQLRPATWCWFRWRTRRAGGLVITTHRAGRLPTLHTCATSAALLLDLSIALGVELDREDAAELHARHAGNVRDALRELYDRWATVPGSAGVPPASWPDAGGTSARLVTAITRSSPETRP